MAYKHAELNYTAEGFTIIFLLYQSLFLKNKNNSPTLVQTPKCKYG
jgi:hypothetical protein